MGRITFVVLCMSSNSSRERAVHSESEPSTSPCLGLDRDTIPLGNWTILES